jgi:hypothetical protein
MDMNGFADGMPSRANHQLSQDETLKCSISYYATEPRPVQSDSTGWNLASTAKAWYVIR